MHIVPNVLPRSLWGWPRKHLLEEGQDHLIVRFAYLCHLIGEDVVFLSFLYINQFELGVEVLFKTDPWLPTTQVICSKSHFGPAAQNALMMSLCCSFASASFISKEPFSQSVDCLKSKIFTICCGRSSLIATPSGRLPQELSTEKDAELKLYRVSSTRSSSLWANRDSSKGTRLFLRD